MRFFDAHCDTVMKVVEEALDFRKGPDLHITLESLKKAGAGAQVFACWAHEERYKERIVEGALALVEGVHRLCAENPDHLLLALSADTISRCCLESGPTAAVIGMEGADPLLDDPENLRSFYDRGVRLLTLAWGDNAFCGSTFGSGSGLSQKGEQLVALCEDLGVVVDVSHASDLAFADICRVAAKPFVASHSNCRAVCGNPRNLTDDMIRALAQRGGVMGINLGSGFLSAAFFAQEKSVRDEFFRSVQAGEKAFDEALAVSREALAGFLRPPLGEVLAHVKHALHVGGEDCVGLGGDLDGVDSLPQGLDGIAQYPLIAELLEAGGLTPRQVEKVCYDNFQRVFADLMP